MALYPLILEKGNKLVDQLINVIIISTALNVLVELSMIIVPGISLKILTLFVHPGVIDIIKTNLQRGRVYFEFYDEISIPILFYLYFVKKNNRYLRGCSLLLLFGIVFISFFSNIRTRFLVTVFVLLGSFFIFRKFFSKNLLKILGVLVGVIFIIFLGYKVVNSNFGFSVLDRFFLEDKKEDVTTISFRINMIGYAIDIGNSHPFFGVGLGNYYEYLPTKIRNESFLEEANVSALLYPHNIFAQSYAEAGIPGLLSFSLLIGYFIFKDLSLFMNGSLFKITISLSFWGLFIFALFNPPTPLTFFANFFVLRSILEI